MADRILITRREDWPERLKAALDAAETKRMSWSAFNCCTFTCDCIATMTGVDPADGFPKRGRMKGRRDALAAMKRFAGGGVRETADRICGDLGFGEIPVAKAGRGDVAFIDNDDGGAIGIVDLSGVRAWFIHPEDGLGVVPLGDCDTAWRVG